MLTTTPDPAVLKLARERLGLTQAQLAARLGVGPTTVDNWETGRFRPRPRRHAALARVLHLDSPGSAPEPPDPPMEEAARVELVTIPANERSPLRASTADSAAQAEPGVNPPRSTPGRKPSVGRLTEHAARGWRPRHAEIEIVCCLCGYRPGQHPAGHRAMWVEAA